MTELNHDFTSLTPGQSLEDAFASLVAPNTWDEDKWEGVTPAGWAIRNGSNGGNKTILREEGFTYPDGDYRASIDFEFTANQGYRTSYAPFVRGQADGSCYYAAWGGNTDGYTIGHSTGGQYAVLTVLETELAANGSVGQNPEVRQWIGIRCSGVGATVTIELFNTLTGAALFSVTDSSAQRIVANGVAGIFNGNATAGGTSSRLYNFNLNDLAASSNPGLRFRAKADAAGSADYPDTTGIDVVVYDAHGGTELLQTTGAVSGGLLVIDDDLVGVVSDEVWVTGEKDGAYVFARKATVVDLATATNYSD